MPQRDVIDRHYRRVGPKYKDFLRHSYSQKFIRTHTQKMVEKLRLSEADLLVDLGCGTGIYAIDLLEQVPLRQPVIGVDAVAEMLREIPTDAAIEPICQDAVEFFERPGRYDKVLIKETIHHIEHRLQLFSNIYRRLSPEGMLLLVHVPPNIEYPLFDAALQRCLVWHADTDELVEQLGEAGFSVERDQLEYQHEMPKEHYLTMVENRYMSVLTSFNDLELAAGLQEMRARHVGQDVLSFIDRFDYLTATKVTRSPSRSMTAEPKPPVTS